MKKFKYFIKLLFLLLFFTSLESKANNIDIASFNELINSTPQNGDIFTFTNDLNSTSSINNHFIGLDITFAGNNHYINGNNTFGGFIVNSDNIFDLVGIRNCQGQIYNNSKFAGSIFNFGGESTINQSFFENNFVNSAGYNFAVAGAVYNLNGGTMNINSSLFTGNYAYGAGVYGGAVANGYENGLTANMTINNAVFKDNFSVGTSFAEGGALYNKGNINISSTLFQNNYVSTTDGFTLYGGALYNIGDMTIDKSILDNNYGESNVTYYMRGGAIYNNSNLTITDSIINGNHASSGVLTDGGAIFNDSDGITNISNSSLTGNYIASASQTNNGGAVYNSSNLTITDSKIDNNYINTENAAYGGAIFNDSMGTVRIVNSSLSGNYINSSAQTGDGGAVYNAGNLIIENSIFKNNRDKTGSNDIYNTGTVNFNSDGTTSILSGIKGTGTVAKNDSGSLNLGGQNEDFTGNFDFNGGTVNLLANGSYFNAVRTNFGNNINFNMQNDRINDVNFGNLNLSGKTNIFPDVDLNNRTMDRINAESISGSGLLFVPHLAIEGAPDAEYISIPFANSVLKDYVQYNPSTINTPIYNYNVSYNLSDGNFDFTRSGFEPSIFTPAVAAQLAGYLTQIDTYKNVFSNLDMVMISPPNTYSSLKFYNKNAYTGSQVPYSPFLMPEQRNGIWIKPYTTFENVSLKNGPKVSNVSYGTILGVESGLQKLKKEWYNITGGYVSYNGSHQAFQGNSIYNNGGLLGAYTVFYRGKMFSAWTANVGANSSEASTMFGNDNFVMLNTGIAQKTGYNFETFKRRFIIQPSILTSYTFVNTFDYTTSANVAMNSDPLHTLHIEPQIKLIGNFKNYLQPYLTVSMVWNLIDQARFKADDVYLPYLSVKPFVQYGAGVQKRWGDRVTGFLEAMIRNGGRNGIALQFGFRISI